MTELGNNVVILSKDEVEVENVAIFPICRTDVCPSLVVESMSSSVVRDL